MSKDVLKSISETIRKDYQEPSPAELYQEAAQAAGPANSCKSPSRSMSGLSNSKVPPNHYPIERSNSRSHRARGGV